MTKMRVISGPYAGAIGEVVSVEPEHLGADGSRIYQATKLAFDPPAKNAAGGLTVAWFFQSHEIRPEAP